MLCVGWSLPVEAHKLAPSHLSLEELREGYYRVLWQRPQWVPRGEPKPEVILPEHCEQEGSTATHAAPTPTGVAIFAVSEIDCGERNIFGSTIAVRPLSANSMVLARITFLNDRSLSTLLTQGDSELRVNEYPGTWHLIGSYMFLGIEHILSGYDHLLFVLGLLLLVHGVRALLILITAFTIGHSISLSLVALGGTPIPLGLADFFVAFSIVWLALELARPQSKRGILGSYPMVMAGAFGLLHGLGFAGALLEIGLPVRDTLASLVSFNVGVELGQVAVVAAAVSMALVLPSALTMRLRMPGIYLMGTVATYWCLDRSIGSFFL
jgi:hypothetical protein